jgi:hypothetical protein
MTPKEKAEELVNKYSIWCWNEVVCDYEIAKQCALIALDEIIDEIIQIDSQMSETHILDKNLKYWIEVKKEIDNL